MKTKSRLEIFSIVFIIVVFMALSSYAFYQTEMKTKPIVREKINSKAITYLYDFYVDSDPNINERIFFGSPNAEINFIAYLDTTSEASRYFMSEIFPKLKQEYIDQGIIKFYVKNHITIKDFNDKNEKFTYATSLLCIDLLNQEVYYPFYFDLYNIDNVKDIEILLKKYKISSEKYSNCMRESEFEELKEDISETEDFGLQGINARFYIGIKGTNFKALDGIPKYRKFNNTIREYGIIMGN